MPSRISPFLRPLLGLGAIVCALSLGNTTRSQDDLPGNSEEAINKEMTGKKALLGKLLKGEEALDVKSKAHTDALDIGARYVVYRFTWSSIEKRTEKVGAEDVYREFDDQQIKFILRNKTNQQEIASAYTKAMIVRAREVLNLRSINSRKPDFARINTARVLAKLAELGQGELADTLVELFNQEIGRELEPKNPGDPKRNDGVTYYLLHGMVNLTAPPPDPLPNPPAIPANLSPERGNMMAEALVAFINKVPELTKDTPPDEIEGYRALRREAVRALANCRAPGLKDKARPGLTLLRIVARDGITPEPRLDECVEAAIGVAHMRAESDGKDYQPDYAAFVLGQFVEWFAKDYIDKKDKMQRPYRSYASRMLVALDAMKADSKDPYVPTAIDQCRVLLTQIEKGDLVMTGDLHKWLDNNRPMKEGLFQGVAESVVKPANRN